MAPTSVHFVAFPWRMYSHSRGLIVFVTKIAQSYPNYIITVLSHKGGIPVVLGEISRAPLDDSARSRIRVVGIVEEDTKGSAVDAMREAWVAIKEAFPVAYRTIADNGSITCTSTGTTFDYAGIPPPSLVLYDIFIPGIGQAVKEITPKAKRVLFFIATTGAFVRQYGPTALGGLGEWEAETMAAMEAAGEKLLGEVAKAIQRPHTGAEWRNPEGIPMYDYELHPQETDGPPLIGPLWEATKQGTIHADGAAICSTTTFEPNWTATARDWYSNRLGKELFLVGPQFHTGQFDPRPAQAERRHPVLQFLDSHAKQSVWLISFGTMWFPSKVPHYVAALLRVLLKNNVPVIFSRAARTFAQAAVPPDLEKEMVDRKLGIFVDFVPQKEVLLHSSLGTFVTHGGVNSMWECILSGVVGIYWPSVADQPLHAAYLSTVRDCAFELLQVRTGPATSPPLRGGRIEGTETAIAAEVEQILLDLKGDVGDRKRQSLEKLRAETFEYIRKGGEADAVMSALVAHGSQD